jgi:hypothetical protein
MCMDTQPTISPSTDGYEILLAGVVSEHDDTSASECDEDVDSPYFQEYDTPDTPLSYVHSDDESTNAIPVETDTSTAVHMNVRLIIPSNEAVCPISLDLINTSHVERFEGFKVDPSRPLHSEIVLPCNHSFSASFLLVSWLTSPMRCPMCRNGLDRHLSVDSFPLAWRTSARDHVSRIQNDNRMEQVASDASAARQMGSVVVSTAAVQIFMVVYYICEDGSTESTVVTFLMNDHEIPDSSSTDMVMRVTRAHTRVMASEINRTRCTKLNMVVFARCVSGFIELVEIANSGIITIPVPEDFPGSRRNTRADGAESRDVWVVQPSTSGVSLAVPMVNDQGPSVFTMHWTHNRSRSLDTLTDCFFNVKFGDLAYILSSMYPTS